MIGKVLVLSAVFFWLTPIWYPVLHAMLYQTGIYISSGRRKPRGMNMIDWLNATGCGIFLGSMLFGFGRWLMER